MEEKEESDKEIEKALEAKKILGIVIREELQVVEVEQETPQAIAVIDGEAVKKGHDVETVHQNQCEVNGPILQLETQNLVHSQEVLNNNFLGIWVLRSLEKNHQQLLKSTRMVDEIVTLYCTR